MPGQLAGLAGDGVGVGRDARDEPLGRVGRLHRYRRAGDPGGLGLAESFAGITVPDGEPEEVFSAGATLSGVSGGLAGVTAQLRGLPETLASWRGPASISYGNSCLTNGTALSAAELALSQCAVVAQSYARDLDEAQDDARAAIKDAREAQQRIDRAKEQVADARDGERGSLSSSPTDRYAALRNLRDLQDAIRYFDSKRPSGYGR